MGISMEKSNTFLNKTENWEETGWTKFHKAHFQVTTIQVQLTTILMFI